VLQVWVGISLLEEMEENRPYGQYFPPNKDIVVATICHLTTAHPRSDVRIFIKEARTLASSLPHKVLLVVSDGKGNVDEKQGGVSIHDLGNLGDGRLSRMLRGPWMAFFAISKIRPDIVHFHDPELLPLGLLLKVMGYKVIYDVHEDSPRQTLSKHYLRLGIRKPVARFISAVEWFGAKAFNAVVPATPKIAERFPARKTVTIQNFPIATELLRPARTPYIERRQSFAYVGVIARIRGAEEMVRGFELLGDIPGARLDLAGSFSPDALGDTVRGMPGWMKVNYHGQVARERVAELLCGARAGLVTLHPTVNYLDSYPVKMFEYMSAGLPVIASDFPLWREIIDGAGCGLLVDPLNPKAIAEAVRWVLEHPAEAEAMGERGKQAVSQRYNWNIESGKLISLYKKVLAQ
jgi:glycosyltransferase involved in cell wall biosynthesis